MDVIVFLFTSEITILMDFIHQLYTTSFLCKRTQYVLINSSNHRTEIEEQRLTNDVLL